MNPVILSPQPAAVPLRILHLESSLADHSSVRAALTGSGMDFHFIHAANQAEYLCKLHAGGFDVILSDFQLPGYSASAALLAAQTVQPQIPYLFVTDGGVDDDLATDPRRQGFGLVAKNRLELLFAAIRGAVDSAEDRRERQREPESSALLEERLQRLQKMEAIGQLTSGIAHEFNNLLSVINTGARLMLDLDGLSIAQLKTAEMIYAAGERGASLTKQLLIFSRQVEPRQETVDLNRAIPEATRWFSSLLGENIHVVLDLALELPPIEADLSMLEMVLLNLAVNGRDAMPTGGTLKISAAAITLAPDELQFGLDRRSGNFVRITVSDTGCGIRPEDRTRIFEPFYTTKQKGKGTGLGLATVFGVIHRHRGWVEVESEVGKGSSFELFFPALDRKRFGAQPVLERKETTSGTAHETIMLVEDDPLVRDCMVAWLRHHGYRVLQATCAEDALEAWKWHSSRIVLLVTDVMMPGELNGLQLAAQLQREKPELKIIYLSGYSPEMGQAVLPLATGSRFLQKPLPPRVLAAVMRELIDLPTASVLPS